MRSKLAAVLAMAVVGLTHSAGNAAPPADAARAEVRIFASGGTPLTNGLFYPGTLVQVYGAEYGTPYEVPRGSDIRFTNTDVEQAANTHCMVSEKRAKRTRRPLFVSDCIKGPANTLVVTSHLKPGIYKFFCPIHFGMLGAIEVTG